MKEIKHIKLTITKKIHTKLTKLKGSDTWEEFLIYKKINIKNE